MNIYQKKRFVEDISDGVDGGLILITKVGRGGAREVLCMVL